MRRVDPCPLCRPDRPTICDGEHAIAIADAFTLGINDGAAADPRGGIRLIFPERMRVKGRSDCSEGRLSGQSPGASGRKVRREGRS